MGLFFEGSEKELIRSKIFKPLERGKKITTFYRQKRKLPREARGRKITFKGMNVGIYFHVLWGGGQSLLLAHGPRVSGGGSGGPGIRSLG